MMYPILLILFTILIVNKLLVKSIFEGGNGMGFPKEFMDRYGDKLVPRKGSDRDFILELDSLEELIAIIDNFIMNKIRLVTIVCYPEPKGDRLFLEYHFTDGPSVISLKVTVPEDKKVPSITPKLPAAGWAEREIMDLFAVEFPGHPNPAHLIIPDHMERGVYLRT